MIYEVLQHGDSLNYYVRNKETGRRVVERVTFAQATLTAKNLEIIHKTVEGVELEASGLWPREIDVEGKL